MRNAPRNTRSLLALALLLVLRVVWVPVHLVNEEHLASASPPPAVSSHAEDHGHRHGHAHTGDHRTHETPGGCQEEDGHEPHSVLDHAFDLLMPATVDASALLVVRHTDRVELRALLACLLEAGPEPLPPEARPPDIRRPRAPPSAT